MSQIRPSATIFFLVIFAVFSAGLMGCPQGSTSKPPSEESQGSGVKHDTEGGPGSVDHKTGKQILGNVSEFHLIDQTGEPFTQENLRGHVTVVNFLFTACPSTCPLQSQWMSKVCQRLEEQTTDSGIRLVSVTVDPENDTPSVLSQYAKQYEANPEFWTFLTGDQEEIWKLSKDSFHLPVALNPEDPLIPIAHDSKFAVVDRLGRIRAYHDVVSDASLEPLWRTLDFVLPEFDPSVEAYPRLRRTPEMTHLAQPPEIVHSSWLENRAQLEQQDLEKSSVRHDFTFVESREESGITFSPQIVDDQRWRLLVNHYDHGNSVSAADVDGDQLVDLYFVSQVGPNQLYRNRGDGTFEEITASAGVAMADQICVAASFADIDNDGDADLYVTTVRGKNSLFLNDGAGKFEDITTDSGLEFSGHSSTGTFFDFNHDGLLDLFLTNVGQYTTEEYATVRQDLCNSQPDVEISYYVGRKDAFAGHLKEELGEQSRLYRNLGGHRFEDVSQAMGLLDTSWSGDAIPVDINSDGWQDLYVLNMQGSDHLYVNEKGERFVERTKEYFSKTPWGAMGAGTLDFNQDGQFDLFLTDMHSDMSEDIGPDREKFKSRMQWPAEFLQTQATSLFGNALYLAQESGPYQETSDDKNAENYWPWGLSIGDLNADGYPDAFLASSMCFPYRYGINSLLLNDSGGRFVDAQFSLEIEPRPQDERLAPWFSLDCSGIDADHPMCRGRSGTVVVWSARGTRSSVLADLEKDGDLDIVTNEFNTPPQVFRSTLSDQDGVNWIAIRLEGTESNRDGLGAVVTVKTSTRASSQRHDGKSGYLSQSCLPLYFGLGEVDSVESITVRWPSGKTQTVEGPLKARQELVVREEQN
ncbi:MAG: VCBS repeat-containing protein [Planctomycetaceae bacterium]|nr:VCBS repeat-containing protein [Planctomycetaceae bacterium]